MTGGEPPREPAEGRLARRNDLFRFRWSWPAGLVAGWGIFFALWGWARWNPLVAIGVTVGAAAAVRVAADMWPRKVPAELAGEVARLQDDGCRLRRRHLFWCTEKDPHVHLTAPEGFAVIVVWHGEGPPPPPGSGDRPGRGPVVVIERWRSPGLSAGETCTCVFSIPVCAGLAS